MSAYDPSFTGRIRVQYRSGGREHKLQVRGSFTTALAGEALFAHFVPIVESMLVHFGCTDGAILGGEYALPNSNLFTPSVSVPPSVNPGPAAVDTLSGLSYIEFEGRSQGGRRARLRMYGAGGVSMAHATSGPTVDARILAAESVDVANVVTSLNNEFFGGIDGSAVIWKPYANIGFSQFYTRKLRRGL